MEGFMLCLTMFLMFFLGMVAGEKNIENDCKNFGKIKVDKVVYECKQAKATGGE